MISITAIIDTLSSSPSVFDLNTDFPNYDRIRQIERWSIREFMCLNQRFLRGRVLDFGAGESPYRDLAVGEYLTYDPIHGDTSQTLTLLEGTIDCIMCNQVMQYIYSPRTTLATFNRLLKACGTLVMTFPTNWDEVEETDLHRFTQFGMQRMLGEAGFTVSKCERRAEVKIGNFRFPIGYGVVAVKI